MSITDMPAPEEAAGELTAAILHFFQEMDDTAPLARLVTAASVFGVCMLLLLVSRFVIGRRVKRLDAIPEQRYKPLRWQAQDLVSAADMKAFWMSLWRTLSWLISVALMVVGVTGLLTGFSWSLNLAAGIIVMVINALRFVWAGFVDYLPNLVTIIVIIFLARYVVRMIGVVFEGISSRRIYLKNFYPEWAETSFGIIRLLVYALTAVIVFPYLPGSSSPAFQGISIFVGVLVSLGSTTAVANVIAGVVLTYTRAFEEGDQVKIAETRGRIVERSTFVTRVQTLKNEIVSIPNSMVLNNNIMNYSNNMGRRGLLVHTSVTIGYDVPWQTVNRLLIDAAHRTENIIEQPEPFVLQTALEDNYVSYEVNGWIHKPELLPRIYSDLHANILDAFQRENIEITSPHYRAVRDGTQPAIPPAGESGDRDVG
ncbi:MAG: mechanosensitive ion channel domain-containing protein [Pseudomonadota bacterium]